MSEFGIAAAFRLRECFSAYCKMGDSGLEMPRPAAVIVLAIGGSGPVDIREEVQDNGCRRHDIRLGGSLGIRSSDAVVDDARVAHAGDPGRHAVRAAGR